MITKEDLENYIHDKQYVKSKREKLEEDIESLQKITSSFEETRIKSAVHDRMAENLAKLLDMQEANLEYIVKEEQRLKHIEEEVEKLKPKYRNILYGYYILGKNLTEVAVDNGYDYVYTCKLNGKGLEILLKKTTKDLE